MKRLVKLANALNTRNPHAVPIWGPWGILLPIRRRDIMPLPFTNKTYWVRRNEWRIFHISDFDLVD